MYLYLIAISRKQGKMQHQSSSDVFIKTASFAIHESFSLGDLLLGLPGFAQWLSYYLTKFGVL
jgi:hypothetical protein